MLPQVSGFILLPIYTSYLSTEEYGIVESMLVLGVILSVFFSMATERSMFRLYFDYKSEEEKKVFLGNVFSLILGFSSIVLLIVFLFRNLIGQVYDSIEFMPYYVLAIANAYVMTFAFIPETLFQVKQKAVNFIIMSSVSFFLGVAFILYFVVVLDEGAEGLLKGKLIGNLIMFPAYIYIVVKNSTFVLKKEVLKNILAFSLPMVPTLLTAWVLNMSNRIFIEQYFSLKEVGVFSLAFKISSVTTILLGAMFTAYNPVFFQLASEENQVVAKDKINKTNTSIIVFAFVLCFGVAFFSKELITFFLDEKFVEAANIVPLIVLSNFFIQISGLYNLMIYQSKKSTIIMSISIIGALFSVLFNFMLIPVYGIFGAALAAIITALIILVIKKVYAMKKYYIALPTRKIGAMSLFAMIIVSIDVYLDVTNVMLIFLVKILFMASILLYFYKKYFKSINKFISN